MFFKTHTLIEILLSFSSSSFAQAIIGQPVLHTCSSHDDLIIETRGWAKKLLKVKSKNPDKASTFLIRRIASGVGVERIFPFFSPSIESIKLNRKGKVRQARIYYMRERAGKRARIKERRN